MDIYYLTCTTCGGQYWSNEWSSHQTPCLLRQMLAQLKIVNGSAYATLSSTDRPTDSANPDVNRTHQD